jgi:hypothetical protein
VWQQLQVSGQGDSLVKPKGLLFLGVWNPSPLGVNTLSSPFSGCHNWQRELIGLTCLCMLTLSNPVIDSEGVIYALEKEFLSYERIISPL